MVTVRKLPLVVTAMILVLASSVACTDDDPGARSPGGFVETPHGPIVAMTAESAEHGTILTDDDGRTLYTFSQDEAGSELSACGEGCEGFWPPLTIGARDDDPRAGAGVGGTLGVILRHDGSRQVTYNGYPLHRFGLDSEPGDVKGHGVGNIWSVAKP